MFRKPCGISVDRSDEVCDSAFHSPHFSEVGTNVSPQLLWKDNHTRNVSRFKYLTEPRELATGLVANRAIVLVRLLVFLGNAGRDRKSDRSVSHPIQPSSAKVSARSGHATHVMRRRVMISGNLLGLAPLG